MKRQRQEPLDGALGQILVHARDRSDAQTKPICMRNSLSQCTSQKFAFVHCFPFPKSNGSMCGSTDHKAITCLHRSRRVSALGQLPTPETATSVGWPLPKPHYISDTTELCTQQSRPARAQRTVRRFHWTCLRDQRHCLSLTEPQCNSDTTEECKHEQSRPFKVQRTSPTVPLSAPFSSTSPLPETESRPSASITGPRAPAIFFLDICAGRSAPLSVAAIKAGLAVLVLVDADTLDRR